MSFFEVELCRKLGFQRTGGGMFNTDVQMTASGQEQRNSNWSFARAEYSGNLITPVDRIADALQFIEDMRTFHYVVGGKRDGFRFYDHLDCSAALEPMLHISGNQYQLQKTYSLGGRTYARTITKPITSAVLDYQGNALANSVSITGASGGTMDPATGLITFASVSGTPTATFRYHIPVRFTSDKFEPEVEESNISGLPIINWKTLGLIEVLPPNF